jgi:predicted nucleic acid-binding protein
MHCVLDSSATLAWVLPGEATSATEVLLAAVGEHGAVVPALWPLETANVLLHAERRGRITTAERLKALDILRDLPIRIYDQSIVAIFGAAAALGQAETLTVYDAFYLELAIRSGRPLGSLDKALCGAAVRTGVPLALPLMP